MELGPWIQSIVNHLYWSVHTCNGDPNNLVERFLSVIHHVCNRHTFRSNTTYLRCAHRRYTEDEVRKRVWLKIGSPAHETLKKILLKPLMVKDLKKMNQHVFTTYLEVFHALKIRYLPKSIFFEQEKMVVGMELAALDHNINVNRGQVSNEYNIIINLSLFLFITKVL